MATRTGRSTATRISECFNILIRRIETLHNKKDETSHLGFFTKFNFCTFLVIEPHWLSPPGTEAGLATTTLLFWTRPYFLNPTSMFEISGLFRFSISVLRMINMARINTLSWEHQPHVGIWMHSEHDKTSAQANCFEATKKRASK